MYNSGDMVFIFGQLIAIAINLVVTIYVLVTLHNIEKNTKETNDELHLIMKEIYMNNRCDNNA